MKRRFAPGWREPIAPLALRSWDAIRRSSSTRLTIPLRWRRLIETLAEQFPERPRLLVFATSVDKDVPRMLEQLLPGFEHVVLTRYLNNPRAMDPVELEKLARDIAQQQGLVRACDWTSVQILMPPGSESVHWRRHRT